MTDMISRADAAKTIAALAKEFIDGGSPTAAKVLNLASDRIRALPAVEVKVRELTWEQVSPRICEAAGYNCIYQTRVGTDGRVRWQGRYMGKWEDADSVEAAKAAAQADYAARIWSAMTVAPAQVADPATIRDAAMREALVLVRGYLDAWDDATVNGSSISIICDAIEALITTPPAVSDDVAALVGAAKDVVARWDTPSWKNATATAEYINRLRAALARLGGVK